MLTLAAAVAVVVVGWFLLDRRHGLRPAATSDRARPDISVIVPARDEELSLPNLLACLRDQDLDAEVIVVDDGSTDATGAIAEAAGARVVRASGPPRGWVGKTWACHLGARAATGSLLVFLDADVRLASDALRRLADASAESAPEGLLSVQPRHVTVDPYEQLSAFPNLVSMMATGAFAAAGSDRASAAFGPCMVTSAAAYRAVGGHQVVAGEVIEDLHLARAYSAAGRVTACRHGGETVSYRMYPGGLRQLVDGWTKSISGGARLVAVVPMVLSTAWVAAAVVVADDGLRALADVVRGEPVSLAPLAAWAVVATYLRLALRRIGTFATWVAALFPVPLAAFVLLFARSAVHRCLRRSVVWRGRTVSVRSS